MAPRNILIQQKKIAGWRRCETSHSVSGVEALQCARSNAPGGREIGKNTKFGDCVILDKEAFDPEAVFLDTIVDENVLPKLSLSVDGLTEKADGSLELPSEDTARNQVIQPSEHYPETNLDPEQLEVYGWESSFWRKVRGYLGF